MIQSDNSREEEEELEIEVEEEVKMRDLDPVKEVTIKLQMLEN